MAELIAELNTRYEHGRASDDVRELGVLLHTFDAMDIGREDVWRPCPEDAWCQRYSDRLSASVVNRRLPSFFWAAEKESTMRQAMSGFVLDAGSMQPVNKSVFCSWGADAGTMGMLCEPLGRSDDCIPGCRPNYECGHMEYESDYCWWPPHKMGRMVALHMARDRSDAHGCMQRDCNYNEVVLSMEYFTQALPQAVAAIFFPANSSGGEAYARRVRNAFQREFHMPEGLPPLVRYHDYYTHRRNAANERDTGAAFTLVG